MLPLYSHKYLPPKAIVQCWPKLEEFAVRSIGNGLTTPAWTSDWIGLGDSIANLNIQIPNELLNYKVADLVTSDHKWNLQLFQEWLPNSIVERIKAVVVPNMEDGQDVWKWPGGFQGEFSVSTTYSLLCGFSRIPIEIRWSKVWKLEVPERVRYFIWFMCHNRLMTNQRKASMHLGGPYCKSCEVEVEVEVETTFHVLRDCPYAMVIWLNLLNESARVEFFEVGLNEWIDVNMNNQLGNSLDVEWRSLWATTTTCHLIWHWRNKEVHLEDFVRPFEPWNIVLQRSNEYLHVSKVDTLVGHAKHVNVG